MAGESEFAFRHVLVRDVAYGSIPRAERSERHRRAAEWIESLGRPEDHAELLAHHYLAALELARAAGIDEQELAAPVAAALLRAGERVVALNSFASAARFFEQALELGVDEEARPQVLFRLGSALHLAADERRVERLEEARDALLAAGDPETAAEACAQLAQAWWHRGRNDPAREQLERAQELVRDRPASASAARVLVEASRQAMLSDDTEKAVRTGRQALALAEQLGLVDLVPPALVNIGTARANAGDEGGVAELERAIEIGLASNNPDVARAYNNLAVMQDDTQRAYELQLQGKESADRLGNGTVGRYIEAQLIMSLYELGQWDAFLVGANEFIAACEAGLPNYNESYARERRAAVLMARDDPEAAATDAARALELAREAKDPQALQPALAVRVRVDLALGRLAEARRTARELLSVLEGATTGFGAMRLALHADTLGIAEELPAVLAALPQRPWIRAASAAVEGDFERAVEIAAENGYRADEAELRLRAAEALVRAGRRAEADVHLRKALDFYRSVGATRYIREGEALLAITA
jgi:tetratricopeptide (TPR) repeat protein